MIARRVVRFHRTGISCLKRAKCCRTWRLEQLPATWKTAHQRTAAKYRDCPAIATDVSIAATQLGDHRLAYLDYEGEVSGGRGYVIRVAAGVYDLESEAALRIKCTLDGDSIAGHVVLERPTEPEKCGRFRPAN